MIHKLLRSILSLALFCISLVLLFVVVWLSDLCKEESGDNSCKDQKYLTLIIVTVIIIVVFGCCSLLLAYSERYEGNSYRTIGDGDV